MSRLDLLRQGAKGASSSPKEAGNKALLGKSSSKKTSTRAKSLVVEEESLVDAFGKLDEEATVYEPDTSIDDDPSSVNVIEIDLGGGATTNDFENESINTEDDIDTEMEESSESIDEKEEVKPELERAIPKHDIVEAEVGFQYTEEDIQLEVDYVFEHREELYKKYIKPIKNGGMEIGATKVLKMDDVVNVSVTLTELREQVGCAARVVSILPKNMRAIKDENEHPYKYWVQFVGPNISEIQGAISRYLLGYKSKS